MTSCRLVGGDWVCGEKKWLFESVVDDVELYVVMKFWSCLGRKAAKFLGSFVSLV